MARKKSKKMSLTMMISLFLVVIGAIAGYFTLNKITENDKFILNGDKYIQLEVGSNFDEETQGGFTAVAFGKDVSNLVKVENVVDFNQPGQYYIRYTVNHLRFRGVERFRIITIVEKADESV